jgi:hypothetical protein
MAEIRKISINNIIVVPNFSRKLHDENNNHEVLENIVQAVVWKCELTDTDTGVTEELEGTTHFQYPEGEFIPYEQITKSMIMSWLEVNDQDIEYKISKIRDRFNARVKDVKKLQSTNIVSAPTVSFDSLPD